MLWLLATAALAADPILLTQTPVVGDGEQTAVVLVQVPGLQESDRVRLSPSQGEVLEVSRQGELLALTLRPPTARRQGDDMPIELKVRGSMKLNAELAVPLAQPTRGSLNLQAESTTWKPGDRARREITITPGGTHSLPVGAREIALRASQGSISAATPNDDGTWTATWTPPSRGNGESEVLIVATDLSAPETLVGMLRVGVQGSEDGKAPVLVAPTAQRVQAGQSLRVWVAAPQSQASVGELSLESEGVGFRSAVLTAPDSVGTWSLKVSGDADEDTLSLRVDAPAMPVQLRTDPPLLGADTRSLSAIATVSGGDRTAASSLRWSVEGAKVNGSPKVSSGQATQGVRVASNSKQVLITTAMRRYDAGLPTARLVAWSPNQALPNDGKSEGTLVVVAVDALGNPVANVDLKLRAPIGDARIKPTARTDSRGIALVSVGAGLQQGPVRVVAETAQGLETELIFWQGAGAPSLPEAGGKDQQDASALVRAQVPVLMLPRIEGSVGKPATVLVQANPQYTTPGAAVLVSLRIQDDQGLPVVGVKPRIEPSVGSVGPVTDNGDGSYLVPVQLPPGVDGPLSLSVSAESAQASLNVPTLQSLGGLAALNPDGSTSTPEPEGRPERTPRGPGGAPMATLRLHAVDQSYAAQQSSSGTAGVPLGASFNNSFPLGAPGLALQASVFPTKGSVGVDFRSQLAVNRISLGAGPTQEVAWDTLYPTMLGVRYRTLDGPVRVGGGAWLHAHDAPVFVYGSDLKSSAVIQQERLLAARLGAVLEVDTSMVGLELLVAESFGPLPQATHGSLSLDLKVLPGPAFLSLGGAADLQHTQLDIDGEAVTLRSQAYAARVGVGASF
ncbi:MAG: Ig-like domain-containing protein [Myxococcota bacterium]|nr:Ig-like domain-containing protein [Myxococcota bacterium]